MFNQTRRMLATWILACCGVLVMFGGLSPVAAQSATAYLDDRSDPVLLMDSLFNAINNRDYVRAASYWATLPNNQTYDQFAAGYADTASVDAFVRLPVFRDAGAGTEYVTMPTIMFVRHTNGTEEIFAGCYVARRSNVPVGDNPTPDPNWILHSGTAQKTTLAAFTDAKTLCDYTQTANVGYALSMTDTAPNLLQSFFNAVIAKDYPRAYNYWKNPPRGQTYESFAAGYNTTKDVSVFIRLNIAQDAGAGNFYMNMPVALVSAQSDGTFQYYGGCYTAHASNPAMTGQPIAWRFERSAISRTTDTPRALTLAVCR